MPALVKANNTIGNGGLQLIDYSIQNQSDYSLGITVNFVCLARFSASHVARFRSSAYAPAELLDNRDFNNILRSFAAQDAPKINSCSVQTQNGLATITVNLGVTAATPIVDTQSENGGTLVGTDGSSTDAQTSEVTVVETTEIPTPQQLAAITWEQTISTDLRSINGSVFDVPTQSSISFSFDYYAQTITTEGTQISSRPSIGAPFNVRGIDPRRFVRAQQIVTSKAYRNNLGSMKYQTTISAIYVQDLFSR